MLVPISPQSYPTVRPRRSVWPVVLIVVLLALLVGGGAVVVMGGAASSPAPVAMERRSTWQGALVAGHTAHPARGAVQPQNDIERLSLDAAHEFGITDTLALAVMEQESGGDPGAVSSAGARGVFQVMPATGAGIAEDLGVANYTPTMLDDPQVNVRFGMYYLNKQIMRFGLTWGLAAYNWGPNNVADVLATYPAARTLDWEAVRQQYGGAIPGETQHYVTNILAIRARLERTAPATVVSATTPAPVLQAVPTTSAIVFPIRSTQGALTLNILSVLRTTNAVTIAVRLDSGGPALAVTPPMLRVSTESGKVYMLPAAWGSRTIPEHGSLDVQLVCTPMLEGTESLVVTAKIASQPPIAIVVPTGL